MLQKEHNKDLAHSRMTIMLISKMPFKKISLYLISVLLGFALIVIIINLSVFDEELHPEVKRSLEVAPEINPQQNAYLALFGMPAATDKDMQQVGIQLIARYLQNRDQHEKDELTDADTLEIKGGKDLDAIWSKQYQRCNSRQKFGCLATMQAQINSNPITDPRFNVMLERYKTLITMLQYQELRYPSVLTPLPQFGQPLDIAKIYLAQLSTDKDPMVFLMAVQKDMQFWRMVLNQGDSLISKMIAVAAMWNDLQYLSDFMHNKTLSEQQNNLIQQFLVTLNKDELNVSEAILGEARWLRGMYPEIEKNWITRAAFHNNATINSNYFYTTKPDLTLAQLSSTQFAEYIQKNQGKEKQESSNTYADTQSPLTWSPSSLYNLVGKLIVNTGKPDMSDYIARVHDLNGMILLVQLQLSLKNVPLESIENSVKISNFKNPYTNQAMQWNQTEGTLQFTCLAKKFNCQVKI